jgi:hypothetical protein
VDPDTQIPLDRNDPHVVVGMLFSDFPKYTLTENAKLAAFNHPSYFNSVGGAWPMADHIAETGECQAIVRFIRAVLMQIGCPGEAKHVAVFADFDVDKGATALEDEVIPRDSDETKYTPDKKSGNMVLLPGLERDTGRPVVLKDPVSMKEVEIMVVLGLADSAVKPGELLEMKTVVNAYEACLKFTFGGKMRYYAGGVKGEGIKTAQEVLHVFSSLVWWRTINDPTQKGKEMNRVEGIACDYTIE